MQWSWSWWWRGCFPFFLSFQSRWYLSRSFELALRLVNLFYFQSQVSYFIGSQDSLLAFLKVNIVSIDITFHWYTCHQILSLPELEDPPIEDWHKYEHVQHDPIRKSPDEMAGQRMVVAMGWYAPYRVPEGPFELNTTWPRLCKEISKVVSEEDIDILKIV